MSDTDAVVALYTLALVGFFPAALLLSVAARWLLSVEGVRWLDAVHALLGVGLCLGVALCSIHACREGQPWRPLLVGLASMVCCVPVLGRVWAQWAGMFVIALVSGGLAATYNHLVHTGGLTGDRTLAGASTAWHTPISGIHVVPTDAAPISTAPVAADALVVMVTPPGVVSQVEVICPGGHRSRARVSEGRAVLSGLPDGECRLFLDGDAAQAPSITRAMAVTCQVGAAVVCTGE